MIKRNIVQLTVTALLSTLIAGNLYAEQRSDKPNILFILADDLGYGDVGCYGQTKIKTPNIDRLAKEGMRFTDHYAGQTVCTPSRASLLLGMHMGHCPVTSNGHGPLNESHTTVAMLLKKAGYKTGMIGKYGLMGSHKRPSHPASNPKHPGHPNQKGFDHWFGFTNQGYAHFYYPDFLWRNDKKIQYPENRDVRKGGHYKPGKGSHAHDLFAKEAMSFIREHRDKPFFLYIPFAIPHAELVVPSDDPDLAYYRGLNWPEKPRKEGGGGKKNNSGYGSRYHKGYCASNYPNATYAAMVSRMDRSIGRIMALLKELNLDKNTLVIFSSDNGASGEGGQDMNFFRSSGPLKGGKRSIYEGGTRVPFIARWPGRIKQGTTSNLPSGFNDFLATACDVAGEKVTIKTDGISYLPTLLEKTAEQKRHRLIYYSWARAQAVRVGNWKLIRMGKGGKQLELYNLVEDIGEKNNLAAQKPEVVKRLMPYFKEATEW